MIKEWDEPKQYKEKTIYYYSDGFTEKDVKYGETKTFTAKYERRKEGFNCKKCGDTHYKTKDILLNKNDWLKVTTPNKITTSTKPPKIDIGFGLDSFEQHIIKIKVEKEKQFLKVLKCSYGKNILEEKMQRVNVLFVLGKPIFPISKQGM